MTNLNYLKKYLKELLPICNIKEIILYIDDYEEIKKEYIEENPQLYEKLRKSDFFILPIHYLFITQILNISVPETKHITIRSTI